MYDKQKRGPLKEKQCWKTPRGTSRIYFASCVFLRNERPPESSLINSPPSMSWNAFTRKRNQLKTDQSQLMRSLRAASFAAISLMCSNVFEEVYISYSSWVHRPCSCGYKYTVAIAINTARGWFVLRQKLSQVQHVCHPANSWRLGVRHGGAADTALLLLFLHSANDGLNQASVQQAPVILIFSPTNHLCACVHGKTVLSVGLIMKNRVSHIA